VGVVHELLDGGMCQLIGSKHLISLRHLFEHKKNKILSSMLVARPYRSKTAT
jgi:hypothetical protein